jgi:DNA repair exonuclease SbcCD ATPase subunit
MRLKHLSICGFRGVGSHLDLPLAHRTIIYGPNGSGKSSVLQAIAWTVYGKLPLLTGGVFTREDALVNDFLDEARAAVTLTLSDDVTIIRSRNKQQSTSRGRNPLTVSFEAGDPQASVERLIGLTPEEFFAAVFLRQETIRDFIFSTPETRNATIDRMLGTYLLRTLVKVVDPKVPAKAIEEAEDAIRRVDQQLSQASVISREVIRKRIEEHGDPAELPQLLDGIRQDLVPIAAILGLPAPEATLHDLEKRLDDARQGRLDTVSDLEGQVGRLSALKGRYEQAAVTGWQAVRQRREQYGDPANLPSLLGRIQQDLISTSEKLDLTTPQATLVELENSLADARRAQPSIIGELEKQIGQFGTLKERHRQAAVTSWQAVRQRREQYGDPANLPNLLGEIQRDLIPITEKLELTTPQATLVELEKSLADARRAQPSTIGELEKQIWQLETRKERYEHASQEVNEDVAVPSELETRRAQIQAQVDALNQEIVPGLTRQLSKRRATERELAELRRQVQVLPDLCREIEQMQRELENLEAASKQGTLYNQILTTGQEYLEQAQPKHCPLCKQRILDLQPLLDTLRKEMPEDVERIRQEHKTLNASLVQKRDQAAQLEQKQRQIQGLETALAKFPEDLERQIKDKQEENEVLTSELTQVQTEITQIEARVRLAAERRKRLDGVLKEIEEALGQPPGGDVAGAIKQAVQAIRERVADIQAIDFQPIADKLDQAKQLNQIKKDEAQLRQQLNAVLEEVKEALGQPLGEEVAGSIDQAMKAIRDQVAKIHVLDLQPIAKKLDRVKQLNEIQKDESRLRELESSYQTAAREKARLNHQIQRLTDLRNALQDIAETTKRHQQAIVTGVLNALDIHRYYQQLDPHPVYCQLQIEPELTKKGTYSYWIKALTDDRSRGTYVQTRFSTAQANCAAISIFLAVNQHLSNKLETVILDDPSQSLDPEHKRRLAQTLAIIPRQVIVATEDPQMFEFLVDAFEMPAIHQLDSWTVGGASLV